MNETIYGIHAIQGLINSTPERIIRIFVLKGREDKRLLPLLAMLEQQGVAIQSVSRRWLDEQTANGVHQGILAHIKATMAYQEKDLPDIIAGNPQLLLLVLDGITDPHNLGACLRSADAAGVHAVIVPKDRSAPLNSIAKKVACGAAETVPLIRVANLTRSLNYLQQQHIWIAGTAGQASHSLWQCDMRGRLALVMGAEGEGMRRLTREHCDQIISIPMTGMVSSLNVSVACGICLFEAQRQRTAAHA